MHTLDIENESQSRGLLEPEEKPNESLCADEEPGVPAARSRSSTILEVFTYPALFGFVAFALDLMFATYCSLVGYFALKFQSRSLYVWMMVCAFLCGILTIMAQISFDASYTAHFGAEGAYIFRICFALLVLGMLTFALPYCTAEWQVLALGVVAGAMETAGVSSTFQLAAAIGTHWTRYVAVGLTLSAVVPLALTGILDFKPTSSAVVFCIVPGSLQVAAAFTFFGMTRTAWGQLQLSGAFNKLTIAASAERNERGTRDPVDRETKLFFETLLPGWREGNVGMYYVAKMLMVCVEGIGVSMITFVGSYQLAAYIVVAQLASRVVGVIVSLLSPVFLAQWEAKTISPVTAHMCLLLSACFTAPLFGQVLHVIDFGDSKPAVILSTYSFACLLARYLNTEIAVGACESVSLGYRHAVNRTLVLFNVVFMVVGLLLGVALVWATRTPEDYLIKM